MNDYLTMKTILLILLLIQSISHQAQTLILRNATVIDVVDGKHTLETDIIIKDGIIHKIGIGIGQGLEGETLDLSGKYVIPGLIDAHVHLANDPNESQAQRAQHLNYFLCHGITSIRDAAGDARILEELCEAIKNGQITGPDIYYAAFMAGPSYFEGNDREKSMVTGLDTLYAPWLQCIHEGDDLRKAMQAAKACGATGVKIYGGFDKHMLPQLIRAAKKEGLKAWGHATLFPAKPSDAAASGMEVISHAYMLEWEDIIPDLEANIFKNYELYYDKINHDSMKISRFCHILKKQSLIFDPTLYLCMVNQMEWSARFVREAYQQGVKVCAGTDYMNDLNRPWPFLLEEIQLYADSCGFTPLDAIRSATLIAAEALGAEEYTGSVSTGKNADLVVLSANPLTDLHQLRNPYMVVKKGKIIKSYSIEK